MKEGKNAGHQQAGVADFEELFKDLPPLRHAAATPASVRQKSRIISPMFWNIARLRRSARSVHGCLALLAGLGM